MRSPNYPITSLPSAIEHARTLWKGFQRKVVSDDEMAKAIGYQGLSGPSRSRLSALKKYGLLERQANGWRVSDRAVQMLLKPIGSPERDRSLRDAINDVELFNHLLQEHQDASEEVLATHLIADMGFTRDGAQKAAKSFLETIALVGPLAYDQRAGSSGDESPGQPPTNDRRKVAGFMVSHNPTSTFPSNPIDVLPLPVLMDDGSIRVVNIPRMSATAFEFFKRKLDEYKPAIIAGTGKSAKTD
jgi:hypothetical protein